MLLVGQAVAWLYSTKMHLSKVSIILSEQHTAECFCSDFKLLVLDLAAANQVVFLYLG